jgi:pimeloyl-ACP methyl ester carboxylesterase
MWHFHQRFQAARPDLKTYWAGVEEAVLSSDAPKIYERAFQQICNDVKPVEQGGKGVTQVFLAGYSRGAIIAVNLANKTRRECGARVAYVGLLDPVNTTMPGWETQLDRGVRHAVSVEKPSNIGATVLTTKYIDGVTRIQNPNKGGFAEVGAITHEQMACPVDDSKGARWNEQKLVEYAQQAGARFAPKLPDTNAC